MVVIPMLGDDLPDRLGTYYTARGAGRIEACERAARRI
jgi:hypothetical protein